MKLRALVFASAVLFAAGCFIATQDYTGAPCTVAEDCPGGPYRCVSLGVWPQRDCGPSEQGCQCEVKWPPDPADAGPGPEVDAGPPPDAGNYCDDIRPIMLAKCVSTCHSSNPPATWPGAPKDFGLDVWVQPDGGAGVQAKVPRIKARMIDCPGQPPGSCPLGQMPPRDYVIQPTAADVSRVGLWIRMGAPLGAGGCDFPVDAGRADGGSGDAGMVRYATDIQPIWTARCAPCHTTQSSGTLSLLAANSYNALVGPNASCNAAVRRVLPNNLQGSMLWRKLSAAADRCGTPMPQSGALSVSNPAEFQRIERWIQQGALNN